MLKLPSNSCPGMIPVLETERLRLEPLARAHAKDLFEEFQDIDLYRYITRMPPDSFEAFEKAIAFKEGRQSRDESEFWLNWVAFEKGTGSITGLFEVTLPKRDSIAFLAYTIFQKFWRKGYGHESCRAVSDHIFASWGVSKLRIEMDTRNAASKKLAESLGAVFCGTNLKVQLLKGEWSDEYVYELTSRTPVAREETNLRMSANQASEPGVKSFAREENCVDDMNHPI